MQLMNPIYKFSFKNIPMQRFQEKCCPKQCFIFSTNICERYMRLQHQTVECDWKGSCPDRTYSLMGNKDI